MQLRALTGVARGVLDVLTGLANLGRLEEDTLVGAEHVALELLDHAQAASDSDALSTVRELFQAFISIAENTELPLSSETEQAIRSLQAGGVSFRESRQRKPARPLPAVQGPREFSVFVDESGTASFDEASQPVLCLVGVLVRDDRIDRFEQAVERLLVERGLPKDLEFHTQQLLRASPEGPVGRLSADERYALVKEFLALGLDHARGLHHLSMLKAMIKPAYRQKMKAQGLNPYTHSVVWFLLTLDRVCLLTAMSARYKYFYDRTDAYEKDIRRIFRALEQTPNGRLHLFSLKGQPTKRESHESRFIQLADAAGYYLNRYRQFEVPAFKHRQELEKHRDKIEEIYRLIKPKVLDYFTKDVALTVDWKALDDFSLKRQAAPWRPPVGRRHR